MTLVQYKGHSIEVAGGETVLESFERAGLKISSSCRAGVCQACLMRVVDGMVPPKSQEGLKDSLKESGHFLPCISRPEHGFTCENARGADFQEYVVVDEVALIGPDIARVRFKRPDHFSFVAGQFVTLYRDDGLVRSYSIASRSEHRSYFDIHVRLVPNGRMSAWFHNVVCSGERLWMEGPKGECCYSGGSPHENLLLAGTGTGMAPLFAIADDALRQGHLGAITICQGALSENRLYLVEDFQELAREYPNVRYIRCVAKAGSAEGIWVGDLKEVVLALTKSKKPERAYLCGDPLMVRDLKRSLFINGLSLSRIHADPFIGCDTENSLDRR